MHTNLVDDVVYDDDAVACDDVANDSAYKYQTVTGSATLSNETANQCFLLSPTGKFNF